MAAATIMVINLLGASRSADQRIGRANARPIHDDIPTTIIATPVDARERRAKQIAGKLSLNLSPADLRSLRSFAVLQRHRAILARSKEADVKRVFLKFLSDQSGATAIEYGLIAAGISLAIIAAVQGLGTNLNGKFTSINASLQ
jgi:pilus assembly protein Flp/PilA